MFKEFKCNLTILIIDWNQQSGFEFQNHTDILYDSKTFENLPASGPPLHGYYKMEWNNGV